MLDKLQELEKKYNELSLQLSSPEVISNPTTLQQIAKQHSSISEIITYFHCYKDVLEEIKKTKFLLDEEDEEIINLAKTELDELEQKSKDLEIKLRRLLAPPHPYDTRDVIMEIRAGTGGEEAALFAGELFRMYTKYLEKQSWKYEIIEVNSTGLGGIKEISFEIKGKNVYSKLKFESGIHRVQRVPITESTGRLHTSAATVAVLPEAEEVDIEIRADDLKIDAFRSSGAGGQSVNKTSSAIRITHLPTNLVVTCQDERSQYQNKEKALKFLRARLLSEKIKKQQEEISQERKQQVKSGDRSEKIRTYNYPQDRVTDHRVGEAWHNLKGILDGNIEEIISTLQNAEQEEKLKKMAD